MYIVPGLLFVFAYLVTCLVLRFGETEHLQTLLERVRKVKTCLSILVVQEQSLE